MSGSFQDFIFRRELSEVYLLMDYISGRADKNLRDPKVLDASNTNKLPELIKRVCTIAWPVEGTKIEQSEQAEALLDAKDKLNDRAQPATGYTVAFTILVADTGIGNQRFGGLLRPKGRHPGQDQLPAPSPLADAEPPAFLAGGPPPTRAALAELAYPGLVPAAARFRWMIRSILWALMAGLIVTCILSWNVAAGRAFLARIDVLAKERIMLVAKIDSADIEESKARSGGQAAEKATVLPYCERHRQSEGIVEGVPRREAFDSSAALRVCAPFDENHDAYRIAYANLADWVAPWRSWVNWLPRYYCKDRPEGCLERTSSEPPLTKNAMDEQWGSVLVEVLANAVLPVFYGFLGAGAAVVRNLWGKMNDSLLSPRDVTLVLAQLALGTLIGGCIGLFVAPTGAQGAGVPTLTGAVTLSASALSFVAGFGVEAVFVALESLIRRVFNTENKAVKPAV